MSFGLINYWPMDNNSTDIIGNANMYNGYNVQFVSDRFGNQNSAIRFSKGYYQVPSGVYFDGDFSVSVWIKINVQIQGASILDFSYDCNYYSDNVIISSLPSYKQLYSNLALISGQWTHLVVTQNEISASIYINGILAAEIFNIEIPRYANRTSNFIGKSCSADDGILQADLDDLRIYNRALGQTEIYDLIRLTSGYTPLTNISTTTSVTTIKPASTTSKPPILSQTRYTNGLINYWPIDNHVNDTVSKANMYNGVNVEFVEDRFKIPNSAIRFSVGSYQIKPGFYFNGDFTISLWVKLLNPNSYDHKIITFTNDAVGDSVYLKFYYNQVRLYCIVRNSESYISSSINNLYGQWTHIAATLSESTGYLYLNGILAAQSNNMYIPRNVNRTSNYVGIDSGQASLWADLDDLRIYNKPMNQSDVYNLFIEAPYNYEYYQSKFV